MKCKWFVLIILLVQFSFSQGIEIKHIKTYDVKMDRFVGIDEIGNIYFIKDNTLFKKSNTETLNYSNVSLGNISMVDIRNPFKVLIFYKEFNSVIILDTKLNELTNKIDFTTETLFNNVLFVSNSSENNIWLFADDNKLHLYNYVNYTDKIQTQPITFYRNNFEVKSVKSNYKNAWILGTTGIIQINEYGNFIGFFEIDQVEFILPFQKGIIYIRNSEFGVIVNGEVNVFYNENTLKIKDIHINNKTLCIFDGNRIHQYELL